MLFPLEGLERIAFSTSEKGTSNYKWCCVSFYYKLKSVCDEISVPIQQKKKSFVVHNITCKSWSDFQEHLSRFMNTHLDNDLEKMY